MGLEQKAISTTKEALLMPLRLAAILRSGMEVVEGGSEVRNIQSRISWRNEIIFTIIINTMNILLH